MTTWKTNFRIITNLPKHYLNSQKQAKFLELLGEKKKRTTTTNPATTKKSMVCSSLK